MSSFVALELLPLSIEDSEVFQGSLLSEYDLVVIKDQFYYKWKFATIHQIFQFIGLWPKEAWTEHYR